MKIIIYFCSVLLILFHSQSAICQRAYITNSVSGTVSVIDVVNDTVIATVNVGVNPYGVTVSPDGARVYVSDNSDGEVRVLSTTNNTIIDSVNLGSVELTGMAITPDNNKIYTGSINGGISVLSVPVDTVLSDIVSAETYGVCISPNGQKAYVAGKGSRTVIVINTVTDTISNIISVGKRPYGICTIPNGRKIYVANNGSNSVSVIDSLNYTVIATITGIDIPYGICSSLDGSKIFVTAYPNKVYIINTTTDIISDSIIVGQDPSGVSITPDGSKLYVVNATSGTVSVINLSNNTVIKTIAVGPGPFAFGNFISPYPSAVGLQSDLSASNDNLLYPNPTSGKFKLIIPYDNCQVCISDILGREIMNKTINEKSLDLEIDKSGIYIISIKYIDKILFKKIIVNN